MTALNEFAAVFDPFRARVGQHPLVRHCGTVTALSQNAVHIAGLGAVAHVGDEVAIVSGGGHATLAEITRLSDHRAMAAPLGGVDGIRIGTKVRWAGPPSVAPSHAWLGRIIDPFGTPLDDRALPKGATLLPLTAPPPPAAIRRGMGARLETGIPVFDTVLPLATGQRLGLFAGSGVGKSTLLGTLAGQIQADIRVIALIGERGRELNGFVQDTLSEEARSRSVVVAATSDQPPGLRRRALSLALTIAEYFRDQGAHVLFFADSITRFAEAHREVAIAAGEPASLGGYPPSLTHALAQLCERLGPGTTGQGDITAVLSVLVAGSDMNEPVADILRGLIDGHVVLNRAIAESGRYPAVDVLHSISRALPEVATDAENALIHQTRNLLKTYEDARLMVHSGLYEHGTAPQIDAAIATHPRLEAFFGHSDHMPIETSFAQLREIVAEGQK